jgi:hypothetical protein
VGLAQRQHSSLLGVVENGSKFLLEANVRPQTRISRRTTLFVLEFAIVRFKTVQICLAWHAVPVEMSIGLLERRSHRLLLASRISSATAAESDLRRTRSSREPVYIIKSAGMRNAYVNSVAPGWFQVVTQSSRYWCARDQTSVTVG